LLLFSGLALSQEVRQLDLSKYTSLAPAPTNPYANEEQPVAAVSAAYHH
jgi:hypothetical protein